MGSDLPQQGAYWLRLAAGVGGINMREEPGTISPVIRVLRQGDEVRFHGLFEEWGDYTWLRVFNRLDGGWIAWNPDWYTLDPRANTIHTGKLVMGDPARWHRLRNLNGGTEIVTTERHERGFRTAKNGLFHEYMEHEDFYTVLGDTSPFEGDRTYRSVFPQGTRWLPKLWTEGESFVMLGAHLRWYVTSSGAPAENASPDHRLTFKKLHRRWVSEFGYELDNVAEIELTFMDGSPFETQFWGGGLVGFRNNVTGWWSSYDGDVTNEVARPVVKVPAWWPDTIGAVVDAVPPVVPDPPALPDDDAPPDGGLPPAESERQLVWPWFAFEGGPGWQQVEGDRVMVLPAGFSGQWYGWQIGESTSPMPNVFNKGDHYQFKFDWVSGRLYVDIDQPLTWNGAGIYTLLFNISQFGPMVNPHFVRWGVCFHLWDGREVVIPTWFNAKDHQEQVFIPVRIADPGLIATMSLVFEIPEASVHDGELRVYGLAMWRAVNEDVSLYPSDYTMADVAPVEDEPSPPPDDDAPLGEDENDLEAVRETLLKIRDLSEITGNLVESAIEMLDDVNGS